MQPNFAPKDNGTVIYTIGNYVSIQLYPIIQQVITATPPEDGTADGDEYEIKNGAYLGFFAKIIFNNALKKILDNNDLSKRDKKAIINTLDMLNCREWTLSCKSKKDRKVYLLSCIHTELFYTAYKNNEHETSNLILPSFMEIRTSINCMEKDMIINVLKLIGDKSRKIYTKV